MWTKFKRIAKAGFVGFWRNAFVSLTSVLVMTIALFVIASTIFSNASLEAALVALQGKVDVNVYFVTTAAEADVLALKSSIEALPEVAEVTYTSREQALEEFKARHENDQLTLQALEELGDNPLGAVLSIRAKETSQYEGIETYLNEKKAAENPENPFIRETNFYKNKAAIDKLTNIINETRETNNLKIIVLILVSIIVSFNTIRLAIHNSRDEIGVMRLVGASNSYISSPFVVTGILQGVIAGVLVLILLYPILMWKEHIFYPFPFFEAAEYSGILFGYFVNNFPIIFAKIVGIGAAIGAISSFLAVRRYLKV